MTPIQDFNIDIDRHVILATNEILAQIMKVKDKDGRLIFNSAERVRNTRASKFKADSPYALLKIGPGASKATGQGTIIQTDYEITVSLVFSIGTRDEDGIDVDYQAYAAGLADLVWSYIEPQLADNPNGMVQTYPAVWQLDVNIKFKDKLNRNVVTLEPSETGLTGSLYAVPLQFGINVFTTVPIP